MIFHEKDKAWDVVRACFYLVATIIFAQIAFGFMAFLVCVYGVMMQHFTMGSCKEWQPDIFALLTGGMAVALGFSKRGDYRYKEDSHLGYLESKGIEKPEPEDEEGEKG